MQYVLTQKEMDDIGGTLREENEALKKQIEQLKKDKELLVSWEAFIRGSRIHSRVDNMSMIQKQIVAFEYDLDKLPPHARELTAMIIDAKEGGRPLGRR